MFSQSNFFTQRLRLISAMEYQMQIAIKEFSM